MMHAVSQPARIIGRCFSTCQLLDLEPHRAIPLIVGVFCLDSLDMASRNLTATVSCSWCLPPPTGPMATARRLNQTSAFGAFLRSVADKFLVCASLLVLVHLDRACVRWPSSSSGKIFAARWMASSVPPRGGRPHALGRSNHGANGRHSVPAL